MIQLTENTATIKSKNFINKVYFSDVQKFQYDTYKSNISIKYCIEGEEHYIIDSKDYKVKAGEYIVVNNDSTVLFYTNKRAKGFSVFIDPSIISDVIGFNKNTKEEFLNVNFFSNSLPIIDEVSIYLKNELLPSRKTKNFYEPFFYQIIQNYYTAVGGYEKIKSIETLSKRGHYIEPAYNIVLNAKIQKKRPNFRIIGDVEVNGFEEGYNGTAWEYHKGKGLILSEGEAKEVILVSSDFDYPFVDAKIKGHKITYRGFTYLGGIKTYDIEIKINVMDSDYITNFYFDVNSYLLIGQRKVMPIHASGEDVEIIARYSDYRDVNGALFPFSQIERNERTGRFLNATIWSEIIANQEIPLSTFDPPNYDN